jgi:hypothetical protein
VSPADDVTHVALRTARALERCGVEYVVGGSVASSAHGEPRATRDIDFAVRLTESAVGSLIAALGPEFSVDEEMLLEAVRNHGSANIFYLPFFTKIDLFVRGTDDYDRAEFSRRTEIEPVPGERIHASSPEDSLLWKLRWFRLGGEVSDQQWRDVLGLLRVSGGRMDRDYLRNWAEAHGVSDLLDRALAQAPV